MNITGRAFILACRAEIDAPKPGNVHIFAGGHDMEAAHFLRSADAAAGPLTKENSTIGDRILGAVEASMAAAGTNTNLGIVLLCAPLARVFERLNDAKNVQKTLQNTLESLTIADAEKVFKAIRHANPGGMGKVDGSDLGAAPKLPLRQIMAEAQSRDRIAKAYADGYIDMFATGLPALQQAQRENREIWWPATATYLAYLAAFPDTHIVRKWGAAQADWVRLKAEHIIPMLKTAPDRLGLLLEFDSEIKARGLNPGTSADLTVATLFCESLLSILQRSR